MTHGGARDAAARLAARGLRGGQPVRAAQAEAARVRHAEVVRLTISPQLSSIVGSPRSASAYFAAAAGSRPRRAARSRRAPSAASTCRAAPPRPAARARAPGRAPPPAPAPPPPRAAAAGGPAPLPRRSRSSAGSRAATRGAPRRGDCGTRTERPSAGASGSAPADLSGGGVCAADRFELSDCGRPMSASLMFIIVAPPVICGRTRDRRPRPLSKKWTWNRI